MVHPHAMHSPSTEVGGTFLRSRGHTIRPGGFSLVELLTVIAVIGLLAGISALALRDQSGGALRSSVNVMISQLQAARTAAVLHNAPVRLLVENSNEEETGLRRMLLVRRVGTNDWEQTGPAVRLPKQVFFYAGEETPHSTRASGNTPPGTMTFDGRDHFYYEFNSTGASERNAGARIVLANGVFVPSQGWRKKDDEQIQGLFLRRIGETSLFEDPEHLRQSF